MITLSYTATNTLRTDTSIGAYDMIVTNILQSAFEAVAGNLPKTPDFTNVPPFEVEVKFATSADLASWTGDTNALSQMLARTWNIEKDAYVVRQVPGIAVNVPGLTQRMRADNSPDRALTGMLVATSPLLYECCIFQALGHTDVSSIYDPATNELPGWVQDHFVDDDRALDLLQWSFAMHNLDTRELNAIFERGSTARQ